MILAFLKWDSEVLLQNRFISVDKASRKRDCVLNHTDIVEKYKIYILSTVKIIFKTSAMPSKQIFLKIIQNCFITHLTIPAMCGCIFKMLLCN